MTWKLLFDKLAMQRLRERSVDGYMRELRRRGLEVPAAPSGIASSGGELEETDAENDQAKNAVTDPFVELEEAEAESGGSKKKRKLRSVDSNLSDAGLGEMLKQLDKTTAELEGGERQDALEQLNAAHSVVDSAVNEAVNSNSHRNAYMRFRRKMTNKKRASQRSSVRQIYDG